MFNWIANISSNRMKATFVLLTWILVVAGTFLISPSLSDVSSGQPEEFLPVGAESVRAMQLGEENTLVEMAFRLLLCFIAKTD